MHRRIRTPYKEPSFLSGLADRLHEACGLALSLEDLLARGSGDTQLVGPPPLLRGVVGELGVDGALGQLDGVARADLRLVGQRGRACHREEVAESGGVDGDDTVDLLAAVLAPHGRPDLRSVGKVRTHVAVDVHGCRTCVSVELSVVRPEVHVGGDIIQCGVAFQADEPQFAAVGFEDCEGTGQATGTTRLRLVLECEKVALGAILAQHLRQYSHREVG